MSQERKPNGSAINPFQELAQFALNRVFVEEQDRSRLSNSRPRLLLDSTADFANRELELIGFCDAALKAWPGTGFPSPEVEKRVEQLQSACLNVLKWELPHLWPLSQKHLSPGDYLCDELNRLAPAIEAIGRLAACFGDYDRTDNQGGTEEAEGAGTDSDQGRKQGGSGAGIVPHQAGEEVGKGTGDDSLQDEEEKGEVAPAGMTWQEAADRLKRLCAQGEKFTSQQKLSGVFGCSSYTINKAIKKTPSLHAWAGLLDAGVARVRHGLTPNVTDNTAQNRELDPAEDVRIREYIERDDLTDRDRAFFNGLPNPEAQIKFLDGLEKLKEEQDADRRRKKSYPR